MARKGIVGASIFNVASAAFSFEAALEKLSDWRSDCYCGKENPFSPAEIVHLFGQFLIVWRDMLSDVQLPCKNVAEHFLKVAFEAEYSSSSALYCRDQWMECWAPMSYSVEDAEAEKFGMSNDEADSLQHIVNRWQDRFVSKGQEIVPGR